MEPNIKLCKVSLHPGNFQKSISNEENRAMERSWLSPEGSIDFPKVYFVVGSYGFASFMCINGH
jgi:hypothetical protein